MRRFSTSTGVFEATARLLWHRTLVLAMEHLAFELESQQHDGSKQAAHSARVRTDVGPHASQPAAKQYCPNHSDPQQQQQQQLSPGMPVSRAGGKGSAPPAMLMLAATGGSDGSLALWDLSPASMLIARHPQLSPEQPDANMQDAAPEAAGSCAEAGPVIRPLVTQRTWHQGAIHALSMCTAGDQMSLSGAYKYIHSCSVRR